MLSLFRDHAFLIFLGLLLVIVCYTIIVIVGKPVDDRIVGTIAVGLAGGLLGFANKQS